MTSGIGEAHWTDTLRALADHADIDGLPQPILSMSPAGGPTIVGITEIDARTWADSLADTTIRETHDGNLAITGWLIGDNHKATVLRIPTPAMRTIRASGALTLEEIVGWFDTWPTWTRDQQLVEAADMVNVQHVHHSLLPRVACEFGCGVLVDSHGATSDVHCGDCAVRCSECRQEAVVGRA